MEELLSLIPRYKKQKAMKDKPMIHNETKKSRNFSLTNTAMGNAENLQKMYKFSSRSELVEFLLITYPALPEQAICQAICATYGKGEPNCVHPLEAQ